MGHPGWFAWKEVGRDEIYRVKVHVGLWRGVALCGIWGGVEGLYGVAASFLLVDGLAMLWMDTWKCYCGES